MDDTNKKLEEQFKLLPAELREFIVSEELTTDLKNISNRYQLTDEQGSILETQTLIILLGLDYTNKYRDNLTEKLKAPVNIINSIVNEVKEKVFRNVASQLAEVQIGIEKVDKETAEKENTGGIEIENPEKMLEATNGEALLEDGKELDRDKILTDIETPPTKPQPQGTAVDQKLGGIARSIEIPKKNYPSGRDPYREPIE
ncbi:MAG: hypothetical protein HQ402_00040 [Parcubacteria group bacterium]|nr:hypothetical protein [Parcubacteria group bacterium]